ncbi:hypothetical protein M413DRAFT_27802 [Hebeloma cylindrosporum]|uniref:Uncharacterized protein n=1 Tax=Hebeloma cylindrosporum TaxID=76867 RepID=A0A0C3CB64_HEBCY|nr:hypothetical protein M413DRAFT_27802 [Hebeloma cylindrosporum h7]
MLLKLIPARQEPTIHFSLCFKDLPSELPTPAAWTSQLSHLMHEDLEVPVTLLSLDRAAGVTCLLEDVTLDMEKGEVRCRFIDGSVDGWYFGAGGKVHGDALVDSLEGIVRDVKESTVEDERIMREREQEREKERLKALERTRSMSLSSASRVRGKSPKHKRQRSLFMHIVSSIGSIITLTSPTTPSPLPFASPSLHGSRSASDPSASSPNSAPSSYSSLPCPPSPTPLPSPGTSPRARALRRAARSALVDTYSRFVLPELVRRFNRVGCTIRVVGNEIEMSNDNAHAFGHQPEHQNQDSGGFCVWILHSMRRRALERMEQILEESGVNAECLTAQTPPWSVAEEPSRICDSGANQEVPSGFEATTMPVPLSFSDDEDEKTEVDADTKENSDNADGDSDVSETETLETDTDGSSVHTPSTMSHVQCYPRPNTRTSIASSSSSDSSSSNSSASSEGRPVTPTDVHPPAPTKALPSLPVEAQLQEPTHDQTPPFVSHHRRLSLPEHPHPHLPQTPSPSQYRTSHLSSVALSEYTQLQDLRTRLGQLVLFDASQARVSADEIKSRLEVLAVRSRRRAWSNKALSLTARSVIARANGSATLGLATPFRGSSLARYAWTLEDFIRDAAASGSPSKASSYGSLSVVYGALAKSSFPSSRPRLRPRIDYEAALAAAVVEHPSGHADDEDDGDDKLVEREFEMYEEFPGPSPIGGRARRHHRRRDVGMSSMRGRGGATGVGRLFPVSEEMEGEDSQEFVMSLSVQRRGRPRRTLAERTFMGCDEVRVEGYDEDDEFGDVGDYLEHADLEVDDGLEDQRELDLELGMGFGASDVDAYSADIDGLGTNMDRLEMGFVERPKIRPRVRTSSMMGVFVQKAKGVQRSLQGGGHRLKMPQTPQLQPRKLPQPLPDQPQETTQHRKNATGLTENSLLCQPMSAVSKVPQDAQRQPQLKTTKAVAAPPSHGNAPLPNLPPSSPTSTRKAMDVPRSPTPTPIYTQVEIDMVTDDSVQISISGMDDFDPSAAYGIKGAALPLSLPNPSRIALGLPKVPLPVGPQVDAGYGLGVDAQTQEEFTLAMDLPRRAQPPHSTPPHSTPPHPTTSFDTSSFDLHTPPLPSSTLFDPRG